MRFTKNVKKITAVLFTGMLAFSMLAGATSASAAKKKVDLNGTYHAALGVQTSTEKWVYRMAYYVKSLDKYYKKDLFDKLKYTDADTQKEVASDGTFTDVELKGNGTYTVSLTDANFQGETTISQLQIATDIPLNDKIKFSDVKVNIDGRDILTFDEAYMESEKKYLESGMVAIMFNHWRPELITELTDMGYPESTSNDGWDLLTGQGGESITVTFTVSGFAYDNPDAVATTPTPATAQNDSSADASSSASDTSDTHTARNTVIFVVIALILVFAIITVIRKNKKN